MNNSHVEKWRTKLLGDLALPGDDLYREATRIDNGRIQQFPALVVLPKGVSDIVATIHLAKSSGLPLHVKAGGHSYAGYSLHTGGILLDLSAMKRMSFDASTESITVEMGARWSDVYSFLESSGIPLIPVGGACTAVGVAGFVLGGGYSFISRSYGLACDSLVSLTIVTADGAIRTISPESPSGDERDLFWACQGGGGGNLGIVVAMTLRVHHPRTTKMLAGTLVFDLERAPDIVAFYNEWAPDLPNELAVYGFMGTIPDPLRPAEVRRILRFQPVFNGEYTNGLELIRPLFEFKPFASTLYELSLPDYLKIVGGTTAFAGRRSYTRSGIVPTGGLSSDFTQICLNKMESAPSLDSFMLWMHQGGKAKEIAVDATAYPHRLADYVFEVAAVWSEEDKTPINVEWAFQTGQELSQHYSGAYVNYIDPLLPNWTDLYYGKNYSRLLEIKRKWDPAGFFAFQQSIGSLHNPSAAVPLNLAPLSRTINCPHPPDAKNK